MMRCILVVERKHLFPGLSPQGFLPATTFDWNALSPHLFFAERDFMERNSHYKQIIPYLMLWRRESGPERVLAYQRRSDHSEKRLGGLWSVGFGGHIEPLDRGDDQVTEVGLLRAAALRELAEETGLHLDAERLTAVGAINSDREDVSSVHFGLVFQVDADAVPMSDDEIAATVSAQAEPHRVCWQATQLLPKLTAPGQAPDGGTFEDWSRIVVAGLFDPRGR